MNGHGDHVERHAEGEHQKRSGCARRDLRPDSGLENGRPGQPEQDHGTEAEDQGVDHAALERPADTVLFIPTDEVGRLDLHADQKADRCDEKDAGRRPGQGMKAQLSRRKMTDNQRVHQSHEHKAQARHDDRPRQTVKGGKRRPCFRCQL
jgi:hypothetical protein